MFLSILNLLKIFTCFGSNWQCYYVIFFGGGGGGGGGEGGARSVFKLALLTSFFWEITCERMHPYIFGNYKWLLIQVSHAKRKTLLVKHI